MGNRRSLLVGIENYGDGFAQLPAARNDVALMREALSFCGYEIEELKGQQDASTIRERFREFCEECGEDDVHLIYFSGHGTTVDGKDYAVPAGVGRGEARDDDYSRVKTNLSEFVSSGLVVFVIDACRDELMTKSGTAGFGFEDVGGPHFVRFFGCSQGEVCQVIPKGHHGGNVSVFSKALANALLDGESKSLSEVLDRTTKDCEELVTGELKLQLPRLNYGEMTAQTKAILDKRIFDPPIVSSLWKRFDPSCMHCLLITSEFEARTRPDWTTKRMIDLAMTGKLGRRVWKAFRECANGRELLNGERRGLAEDFKGNVIKLAAFNVKDAFDDGMFDEVVRGLVEADLAIFDTTRFEPGVMLLMGIRSACRRGISISTHGAGWHELDKIDIPFNLRDLSLGSHTEPAGGKGKNPVTEAFVQRVEFGFRQMARQPRYQDLPAYDALRQLGPLYEAASTIPVSKHVLVLASYGKEYKSNWEFLENCLEGYLSERTPETKVVRLIDIGNPQLISQSLYEQIRRVAGCVVDWTEYSPSTFFELGVRLAVSDWGAVQLVDERYLPGGEEAHPWESMSGQIGAMRDLFGPLTYRQGDESNIQKAAEWLSNRNPDLDRASDETHAYARVCRQVSAVFKNVSEAQVPVYQQLKDAADALHHPLQAEKGAPQILFRDSGDSSEQITKRESERAAMELRIAAWLYMHYRLEAGKREPGDPLRELHQRLGEFAANALFDADDLIFAQDILDKLGDAKGRQLTRNIEEARRLRERATVERKRGDALRKAGKEQLASEALEQGAKLLEQAVAKLQLIDQAHVAVDLAETHGALGGLLRRLGRERLADAQLAYNEGARVEEAAQLASTYNRLNAIKLHLLTGTKQLRALEPQIQALADLIESNVRHNVELGDSGWAWADLGDCRALLGNLEGAHQAYVSFIRHTETKSPQSTLTVLNELADRLFESKDPDAQRVRDAAAVLLERLERA